MTLVLRGEKERTKGIPGGRINMKKGQELEIRVEGQGEGKVKSDLQFPFQGYQADGEALNRT